MPRSSTVPRKILLVGPVGAFPWRPVSEIAAAFASRGCDVTVHDPSDSVFAFPYPRPLVPVRPLDTHVVTFLLKLLGRHLVWRRRVRGALRSLSPQLVVVWDPLIAVFLRTARPRGVRVGWIAPPPPVGDIVDTIWRRLAYIAADAIFIQPQAGSKFRKSKQIVAPYVQSDCVPPSSGLDSRKWTLLTTTFELMVQRKGALPFFQPEAVVIDGRRRDHVPPGYIDEFARHSKSGFVHFASDARWLSSGPAVVLDTGQIFAPDHRHWAALLAGAELWVPPDTRDDIWFDLVERHSEIGWDILRLKAGAPEQLERDPLPAWCIAILEGAAAS